MSPEPTAPIVITVNARPVDVAELAPVEVRYALTRAREEHPQLYRRARHAWTGDERDILEAFLELFVAEHGEPYAPHQPRAASSPRSDP